MKKVNHGVLEPQGNEVSHYAKGNQNCVANHYNQEPQDSLVSQIPLGDHKQTASHKSIVAQS